MDGNYIRINRSILEWEWYGDINTCRLFVHMLLKANWRDRRYMNTTVPRGSFVSSITILAEETGLTQREIRTAISHLKTTGEVTVKSTNKYSVFTVNNYDAYQSGDRQDGSQPTGKRQANDRPTTRLEKEGKKEIMKEEKNIQSTSYSCQSDELSIPLKDGSEHAVTEADIADYKNTYPLVDVEQEIRVMRRWCMDNPQKRKTTRGVGRFINGWLSREQSRRAEAAGRAQARNQGLEAWADEEK